MIALRLLPFVLLLSGCASTRTDVIPWFKAPPFAEQQAERERCHKSALCRAMIDNRPPVLFLALSDNDWCVEHAKVAERIMRDLGYETRLGGGRVDGVGHVWLEVRVEGQWWTIDNGALPWCDRICLASEARHGL